MKIKPGDFQVPEGVKVNLKKWPTHVKRTARSDT